MHRYVHKVQYYETDKMGIVHHSNYIRWMEEARIDFLSATGWDFERLEASGIYSPVISVSCRYRISCVFPEEVAIFVGVEEFKGVKLKLVYRMENAEGKLVCEGRSEHCFLDKDGKPIRMKKEFPGLYEMFAGQAEQYARSVS